MSVNSLVAVLGLTDGDLLALLEVATIQMDCVDEDEAAAYGLTLDQCVDLHTKAQAAIAALAKTGPTA